MSSIKSTQQNSKTKALLFLLFIVLALQLLVPILNNYLRFDHLINYIDIQKFLTSILNISEEKAAPMTVSIWVFLGGIISSILFTSISGISRRYRYRRLFVRLSKVASKSLMKKSYRFLECANSFDVSIKENFRMNSTAVSHLDNLQKIDFKVFYEAFFSGLEAFIRQSKTRSAFDNIFASISHIQSVENRYEKQFDAFLVRYNNLEEKRNKAIVEVKKIMDKMIEDVKGKNIPDDISHEFDTYIRSLIAIINCWKKEPNRTLPSVFHEKFIQKIRNLNELYDKDVRVTKHIPKEFYNSLNDADNEYQSIKILIEANHKIFLSYSGSYKNIAKSIFKNATLLSKNILSRYC